MTEEYSFQGMLDAFWNRKTASFHTATPGKIIKYDSSTRFATVKPLIKYQFIDEDSPRDVPNLQDVPVCMPGTASGCIHLPGLVGATGFLIFSESSIEDWLSGSGNAVFPTEGRKFDISDAIFIPGVYPEKGQYVGDIDEDTLDVSVKSGTKIRIGNGTADLISIVDEILTLLQGSVDAAGSSSTGTNSLINANLATLQSTLSQIKS